MTAEKTHYQRRTNRPVKCCIECRRRKIKCSRTYPCTHCVTTSKNCVFISNAPPVSSSSGPASRGGEPVAPARQQPTRGVETIRECVNQPFPSFSIGHETAQATLPRYTFPSDYAVQPNSPQSAGSNKDGVSDLQLLFKGKDLGGSREVDYDNDEEDPENEWILWIGKVMITERIGGTSRPHMHAILESVSKTSTFQEHISSPKILPDPMISIREIDNGSKAIGRVLFHTTPSTNLHLDLMPTQQEANVFYEQYFSAVAPIAYILDRDAFFSVVATVGHVERSHKMLPANIALVASVCYAAAVSMDPTSVQRRFGISKDTVVDKLKANAEKALQDANFMTSSKFKVLQAFTIFLIAQCRGEISRSHSVLVGALVRLAQCAGIHQEAPFSVSNVLQSNMRRLLWHQIIFLQLRTGEAQGPLPMGLDSSIPMPLNFTTVEQFGTGDSMSNWTDATFTIMRYECYEIHRAIFSSRPKLDSHELTLQQLLDRVSSQQERIRNKYLNGLDLTIPIQRYAKVVMDLLLARCDAMTLAGHEYEVEDPDQESRVKLRYIEACLVIMESGAILETAPELAQWSWYADTYQQYHCIFYILVELQNNPQMRYADRAYAVMDHCFGECGKYRPYQRPAQLLALIKENLGIYLNLRGVRTTGKDVTPPPEGSQLMTEALDQEVFDETISWMDSSLPEDWSVFTSTT